ncbi:MAG: VOC family protein [Eubacteriaceae bacterium]|nr:VOC family protein [Eubacteriaceae bacterium]
MVTPYIVFSSGLCEEAVSFYEKVFTGKNKTILRYDDYKPDTDIALPIDLNNYVLHAELEIYNTKFTFADEVAMPVNQGNMIYLTINPESVKEAKKICNALIEDGEFLLNPTETFYSPLHTTIKDKFGILWNIIVVMKCIE